MRKIKLAIILTATLAGVFSARQPMGAAADQERPKPKVEIVGFDVPMSERPGADDGAAFVIHFTGDTHGSLEECG
ncbi:MAG TPA: hypothetical protein VNO70_04335 [Blastocatellia bacterium]|nr:hypothetical protein [Blastocatellia bacterium]